jgi:hypothetical protein
MSDPGRSRCLAAHIPVTPFQATLIQFFNLTNRANFGNTFAVNIRSATFGQPTESITPARTILPNGFAEEMGAKFSF